MACPAVRHCVAARRAWSALACASALCHMLWLLSNQPCSGAAWPSSQAAGQKWFTLAFITADQRRLVPAWGGVVGMEKQLFVDQVGGAGGGFPFCWACFQCGVGPDAVPGRHEGREHAQPLPPAGAHWEPACRRPGDQ